MNKTEPSAVDRRHFLHAAGAAAGGGLMIMDARLVRGSQANSRLELGVIGSGSRGDFISKLFEQHTNTKVVALHDYFADRVAKLGDALEVETARRHTGLEGYRELVAGRVDAVAIESPPYFHPEQAAATLAAGKHLYLAKPIAVDVPGCLSIVEAAGKVRGKLSVLVDFQTRNDPVYREAARRVRDGAIGKPVAGQVYYHARPNKPRTKTKGTPVSRVRNWLFDGPLSGDIIVEQNIHSLDVANWLIGAHPVKAQGSGRRSGVAEFGDYWDQFIVTYWYPNDVTVDFSGLQFVKGYDDICARIYGTNGTVDTHYSGDVRITGDQAWPGGTTKGLFTNGAVNNIKDFYDSVVNNRPLFDTVAPSADSTLTGILGRTAAYTNRTVTWDEMLAARAKVDAKLRLPADGPATTE